MDHNLGSRVYANVEQCNLSDFGRDDEVGIVFQTGEEASRRRGKQKGYGFCRMQKKSFR